LIKADSNNYFAKVLDDYFKLLDDEKFTTAKCCIECSRKIILTAPEYADRIFNRLLNFVEYYEATTKRVNLLRKTFYAVYKDVSEYLTVSVRTDNRIKEILNSLKKK
jgi:hypothetical protein